MKHITLLAAGFGSASMANAETAPSEVQFGDCDQIDASQTDDAGDPAAGLLVMVNG